MDKPDVTMERILENVAQKFCAATMNPHVELVTTLFKADLLSLLKAGQAMREVWPREGRTHLPWPVAWDAAKKEALRP